MNIQYLKYIVEVDRLKSIKKAADSLYMDQPNLSRIIKSVEEDLNIVIFIRNSKGVETTDVGNEFILNAKKLIDEYNNFEHLYKKKNSNQNIFSIVVPRATYISYAFINLLKRIDKTKKTEFNYKETNVMDVIKRVADNEFNLGILRFQPKFKHFYEKTLLDYGLKYRIINDIKYSMIMSKNNPLALKEEIQKEDLKNYMELIHGDPYIPLLSSVEIKDNEFTRLTDKNVYIYERGSQFDILQSIDEMYMWNSPISEAVLQKYNLVQRKCVDFEKEYEDVLIYRMNYHFNKLDEIFIDELMKIAEEIANMTIK